MKPLNAFNKRLQTQARPRAQRILKMRDKGLTWEAIGLKLRISRQRAQQIAANYIGANDA